MKPPIFPENEFQRLEALYGLNILDTPAEAGFDRLTRIAQRYFKVPTALVSLVDANRQWFKSRQGLEATETPRNISFCGHAILEDAILYIPNALEDARFSDNPLVIGPPHIRFYVGAPLSVADGSKVGTLCIMDTEPRTLNAEDFDVLRDLADCVEQELMRGQLVDMAMSLSSHEARLRAVLNNVVDGIVTINAMGVIETFNPSAERIFGYGADEVIGKNVNCLMPEPYHSEHDDYLAHYRNTGVAKVIGIGREVVGRRKDGSTFPMELAVSDMQVGNAQMFTGIVRDITDRKQAEKVKNEFISTVSHELRTPLTSIKGSLGLIKSGAVGELPEKLRRMLDIAYNNSDRLIRLINDLLDIEKISAGKVEFRMRPFHLELLLMEAIEANKGFGEQHQVAFVMTEGVPDAIVSGDHDRLMQVLTNLMSNAAKFSPQHGQVEISLQRRGSMFRVSVTDHGPGIPQEFQGKIFQRFSQADSSDARQKGGTGLGLSISRAIVEQHGGSIGFDTRVDAGTTFFFDIPVLEDLRATEGGNGVPGQCGAGDAQEEIDQRVKERREMQLSPGIEKEAGAKNRILICEDDGDFALVLSRMLEQDGFATVSVTSARQAKAELGLHHYDAMTLDLGLPDQDGVSLIRELRSDPETQNLPIIVVSGRASEGAREFSGDAIGVIDWIEKPIDQERLSTCLRRAVRPHPATETFILHVEDDPDILQITRAVLRDLATVVPATTLAEAKLRLLEQDFDLVILDLTLPDGEGEDLLPLLKGVGKKSIPVIVFSAKDVSDRSGSGVSRALIKSQTSNEMLLDTIRAAIDSSRNNGRKDGGNGG